MKRTRGRPRQYEPQQALEAAMAVFWERGYSATSLADLSEAMGMNRPSMYAAFGDKRAIYLQALQRYQQQMRERLGEPLMRQPELGRGLTDFYFAAIDIYLAEDLGRGCMIATTASVESSDEVVRTALSETIDSLDDLLGRRMALAAEQGELPVEHVEARGRLATAVLHSLSIRARAGHGRRALRKFARESVGLLLGSADAG
ncbi:MAG: TetR/AcrR family transcriptional regulator [Myxococcales bacterium]|nr:TetR/AcrR family transcriptional regulator [Myxococcales bacterium]